MNPIIQYTEGTDLTIKLAIPTSNLCSMFVVYRCYEPDGGTTDL